MIIYSLVSNLVNSSSNIFRCSIYKNNKKNLKNKNYNGIILFVIFAKSIKNRPFLFGIKIKNSIFALFNKNFMISFSI